MIPLAAALWGFAEATIFFIVPDVLLMFVGLTSFRRAFRCSLTALLGALIGGGIMFMMAKQNAGQARLILDNVPGIQQPLIESVRRQVEQRGLSAVLWGPLKGVPYKIYAVEEAAGGETLPAFWLYSVVARYVRFFLSACVGAALGSALSKRMNLRWQYRLLGGFWAIFYLFYFWRFGW